MKGVPNTEIQQGESWNNLVPPLKVYPSEGIVGGGAIG